jgi:(p)ppGpp synthase/HD superfamily hydrolase
MAWTAAAGNPDQTKELHFTAEYGVAAHWSYKADREAHRFLVENGQ